LSGLRKPVKKGGEKIEKEDRLRASKLRADIPERGPKALQKKKGFEGKKIPEGEGGLSPGEKASGRRGKPESRTALLRVLKRGKGVGYESDVDYEESVFEEEKIGGGESRKRKVGGKGNPRRHR